MMKRLTQAVLTGMLLAVGSAGAKPPGPPADPRVSGHEGSPIEREFHEVLTTRITSNYRPIEPERSAKPLPIANWLDWLRDQFEHGFTMPLGTVEVQE